VNVLLLAAAIIALLVGLVHSILGEVLIFNKLRESKLIPTKAAPPLQARNIRILWATWHLASVFGWAFAGILYALAQNMGSINQLASLAAVFAFLGGSLLVLISTRGKHPGWLGLLLVALLVLLSGYG